MERIPNPEIEQYALDHLANLYNIRKQRQGIHLSTLVYCLTSSYFDLTEGYIQPTEEEVMLFALGYGLQDVLTPQEAETPVYEKDGIVYSPDFMLKVDDKYFEIKTTRMSSNKPELPETWIEYIMGGCYIRGVNEYVLVVLHMMGNWKPPFPQIHAETLKFTNSELKINWEYLIGRRDILLNSLQNREHNNKPPTPKQWCKEWECKYCHYSAVCDALRLEE